MALNLNIKRPNKPFEVYKVNETETKTSLNIFLFAWSVKSVNDTVILKWSNDSKSV